jgi:phosphatidylserine/phosphatidylglycerophosphate/cardiolipin synthase-like enzyme
MNRPIEPVILVGERDLQDTVITNAWVRTGAQQRRLVPPVRVGSREVCVLSPEQELTVKLAEMARWAKDVICVSSFLIQRSDFTDELLKAASRGVRCYLLTAQKKDLMTASAELTDYERELVEEHKKLLDELAGKVKVRTSDHFHAKFALFDPKDKNPWGVMSTSNLVVEAMRGKNLELSVSLTGKEVRSFYHQFVRGFWQEASHELRLDGVLKAVGKPPIGFDLDQGDLSHPATYRGCNTLRDEILEYIDQATRSITIGAWSFQPGYGVASVLEAKAEKGVKVQVLCRTSEINTKALLQVLESGASVHGEDRMHAKFLVVDGERGLIMTSNFGPLGLDEGFESAVRLNPEECGRVESMLLGIAPSLGWELRSRTVLKDCPDGELRIYDPDVGALRKAEIIPEKFQKNLETVKATDLRDMRAMTIADRTFKSPNAPRASRFYRTAELRQRVEPPLLLGDMTATGEVIAGLPEFTDKGGKNRAVATSTWEDLDAALRAGLDGSVPALYAPRSRLDSAAKANESQTNKAPKHDK